MAQYAIVAIPEKDDPVWKISSEQVPHMTLLYLGEQEDGPELSKVAEYIRHAAETMLHRFWMSVDRRGTLGPKDADVLFFEKAYCPSEIKDFRSALLKDPDVLEYFNSVDQYPEWTPHLTLGYPDNPAKPDTRDYPGFGSVRFDRIAFWFGDFKGPETQLKSFEPLPEDVLHSDLMHAQDNLQGIFNSMTKDQRELSDLLVGAAAEDIDLPANASWGRLYDQMTDDQRNAIHFVIGGVLQPDFPLEHEFDGLFLTADESVTEEDAEHYGVRGMKWGIRKGNEGGAPSLSKSTSKVERSEARAKVKAGTATLGEAHVAALKSTGHRVTNAMLGDKTHWKRVAGITAAAGVGAAASLVVPGVLPTSVLHDIAGLSGFKVMPGDIALTKNPSGQIETYKASEVGATIAGLVGIGVTAAGTMVAQSVNSTTTIVRAIRGNARVNNSYAKLGNAAAKSQADGAKRTQKLLNRAGSIPKRRIRHEELVENILTSKVSTIPSDIEHKVEFDESSVKRDKGGKFSTRNELVDNAWLTKIKDELLLNALSSKEFTDMATGIAEKYGFDPKTATLAEVQDKPEYMPGFLKVIEKTVEKSGTSPSGQFKVTFTPKDGAVLEPIKPPKSLVKHSEMTISDFFASVQDFTPEDAQHYGVRGMKWGVSKGSEGASATGGAKKSTGSPVEGAKREAIKNAIRNAGGKITGIKNSPKYKGKDLTKNPSLQAQYDVEVKTAFKSGLIKAAKIGAVSGAVAGTAIVLSPVIPPPFTMVAGRIASSTFMMDSNVTEHADRTVYRLIMKRDDNGFVTELDFEEVDLEHSADVAEYIAFIENASEMDAVQYGIRGMRWGIRRSRGEGGLVDTSEDAQTVQSIQAKIRSGGVSSLTNAELQTLNTRINLENNLAKAMESRVDKAHAKIKKGLDLGKSLNDAISFATSPAGHLIVSTVTKKNVGLSKMEKLMLAKELSKPKDKGKKNNK